jgi:hypothetical protein
MKKSTLIACLFCLISYTGLAQDKGYLIFTIGPSFPTGDFASKNLTNEHAAFASTGAIFDLAFAYKLGKNFGLAAVLRGQSNTTDAQAIADESARQYPGINWTVETQSWGLGALLIGGNGSFPICTSNKTSFEVRALIGFGSATSPQLKITGSSSGNLAWVNQASATASSAAYLIGAGFKFNVGSKVCLLTTLDYFGSKPEFKNVLMTASTGDSQKNTFSQSIETINLGIGFGFRL